MKTEAYNDFLIRCIRQAVHFAGEDPVVIYINPSDEKKRSDLEDAQSPPYNQLRGFYRRCARSHPLAQYTYR